MDHFQSIPNEIFVKIINFLPLKDINRCKVVCKRWNLVINSIIKLRNLVICDYLPIRERCFELYEPVDCTHLVKINNQSLDYIISKLDQSMFVQLRRLYITNIYDKFLEVKFLNNFKQLKTLEILHLKLYGKSCTLNLPSLSVLNIDNVNIKGHIIFDTLKLEKLRFNLDEMYLKKIKFEHNESIKILEMTKYNCCARLFSNLEYLYCQQRIKNFDLSDWPKLKEIQFYEDEEVFKKLHKQKDELKRDQLKIYFYGVQFAELPNHKVQTYLYNHYIKPESIQIYGPTFSNLANILPFNKFITYSELEDCSREITGNISVLIKKFVNLSCLIVTKRINNYNQFISVLKDCPNLNQLELRSAHLEQHFFDNQLVKLCPNLISLGILKENAINFGFLNQFKRIQEFSVDQSLTRDFVCNLIKNKNFMEFSFKHTIDQDISICCSESINEFKLVVYGENIYLSSKEKLIDELRDYLSA